MIYMADDIVLDVREMDDDVEVRMQVGRFECIPEARCTHGFTVAVTRTFPDEPASFEESAIFEPSDVFSVRLYVSQKLRAKLERVLFDTCFGVFAYATYLFFNPGATLGFEILMTIARTAEGFALTMAGEVSVSFRTLDELQTIMPPFAADGERGYEDARRDLIADFRAAL